MTDRKSLKTLAYGIAALHTWVCDECLDEDDYIGTMCSASKMIWQVFCLLKAPGAAKKMFVHDPDDVLPTYAEEQEFKAWFEKEFEPFNEGDDAPPLHSFILEDFRSMRSMEMSRG